MPRALRGETWEPPLGVEEIALSPAESLRVALDWSGRLAPSRLARSQLVHCHVEEDSVRLASDGRTLIGSEFTRVRALIIEGRDAHAICPSWYPAGQSPPWDERDGIDASIVESLRSEIVRARRALMEQLEAAAVALPRNGWIAGQRVRFAVDQGDTVRARRAAAGCDAEPWWCAALVGYLAHHRGETERADSIFVAMLAQMRASTRCSWSALDAILDDDARRAYASVPCASRDSVNAIIWWLGDPLYTEPRNERRAEHYARRVSLNLRSGTDFSERWDLRPTAGGEVVAEMLLRYGWPNYSYWGGPMSDAGHFRYLGTRDTVERSHGRFATAEYEAARYHPVPSWRAIAAPARARVTDWAISASAHHAIHPDDTLYWPREHYDRRAGPLIQLWNQAGMFRRDDGVLLVVATNLVNPDLIQGDTLRGHLVVGASSDSMRGFPAAGIAGTRALASATISSGSRVASLELHSARNGAAARTRFGVEPPPSLAEMKQGDIAISEPVLIRPADPGEIPSNEPGRAISLMYGTLAFDSSARIGVYWETYGIAEGDTVGVQIRITRHLAEPGLLRRFAIQLGIAREPSAGSSVGWHEPQPGRTTASIQGRIPIQGRNVALDLSGLGPGEYTLSVNVTRAGATPLTSQRRFSLVPR